MSGNNTVLKLCKSTIGSKTKTWTPATIIAVSVSGVTTLCIIATIAISVAYIWYRKKQKLSESFLPLTIAYW